LEKNNTSVALNAEAAAEQRCNIQRQRIIFTYYFFLKKSPPQDAGAAAQQRCNIQRQRQRIIFTYYF
jgi:hypothetical protein